MADETTEVSETETTTTTAPAPPPPETGAEDVGALKSALKKANNEAAKFRVKLQEVSDAQKTEHEKELDKARKEADTEARKQERERSNALLIKAEVKVAAAGKLADAEDAVRFLDLGEFSVTDEGEVDSEAISKAIANLVESKPYLAPNGRKPQGNADGGARKDSKPDVSPGMDRLRSAYATKP